MSDPPQSESLDVLLLAEDFYPKKSGGAFIDWNVATHLVEAGDTVTVVTPRNGQTAPSETVDGVEIRRPFRGPPSGTHPNSPRGILRRILFVALVVPYLCWLCWRREFSLIYSTNHLFHPPASLVSSIFRLSHISFVGYSPSIQEDISFLDPLVLLERLNFRWFMGARSLCRTPSVEKILSEESSAEVARIDGIVDREAIRAAVRSSDTPETELRSGAGKQLIFVGRLVEIKNATRLPALVAQLPPAYSLLIVGDGPQRESVESAVHEADVGERVHFAGRLDHRETLQLIRDSDALVLPSKTESYGAVVFEALSLNTPVLATPVGVLPTIDHRNLTTAPLEEFSRVIPELDLDGGDGIDEETLEEYSVDRFATDVRKHILDAMERDRQPV